MIITILMLLGAMGMLVAIAKAARYRALGPDGRRAKKLAQLQKRREYALKKAAASGSNAAECISWTMCAKVADFQIENLQADMRVRQLESRVVNLAETSVEQRARLELEDSVTINPEPTPLELELGIGPGSGAHHAQQTIDRIDAELAKEEAIAAAHKKFEAEQAELQQRIVLILEGKMCKHCFGQDHKAEDCIENPATINESVRRQEQHWLDRDAEAKARREASKFAQSADFENGHVVSAFGVPEPILEYRVRHINTGHVSLDEARSEILDDLLKHLKGLG